MRSRIESRMRSRIESRMRSRIESRMRSRIESRMRSRIESRMRSRIESLMRSRIESRMRCRGAGGVCGAVCWCVRLQPCLSLCRYVCHLGAPFCPGSCGGSFFICHEQIHASLRFAFDEFIKTQGIWKSMFAKYATGFMTPR